MPQPGGPREGRETSAQQAERVAREIIRDLEPVLTGGTGEQLEALKGRISGLITDKLQGLDEHTKRTARGKLREFLTRDVHALPDILKRNADKRNVVLRVNEEGQRAEKPASGGGGYGFGVPESIKPENLGFWGHAAWAGGIVAVLAYLFGKTKEGANNAWEWTKKVIGLGLIGIGAFLGVKTWAEFQKHKDDLLKARQAAADALASARDATRRLAEGIDGPRQAVEVFRLSRIYERIENDLHEKGVRGGGSKAQADLNAKIYSVLKGKENLQKAFFAEVHRTFPVSFRSREDIRLEFIIDFKSDTGFEAKERLADTDERLALAEAAQGLFGIYANKNDKNYLSELNNAASGMRADRLVRDRVLQLVHDVPAIRALTIAELKPLAECTTLQECLAKNKAVFDTLPEPTNVESQVALWFLAKSLARKSINDPDPTKSVPPGLVEQFVHGMTIDGRFVDTDETSGRLTVVQVLDRAGQYLRLISRVHTAADDRTLTERIIGIVFERGFSLKEVGGIEALSPRVKSTLARLPLRGNEDLFLVFCGRHEKEYMSVAPHRIHESAALSVEQKQIFEKSFQELQRYLAEPVTTMGTGVNEEKVKLSEYLAFFLLKNGKPLSGGSVAKESLERALQNLRIGDAVELFLYLEEAKLNNRIPRLPLTPQAHGRFLLHYKVIELVSRVSPAVASEMYTNFTRS